jgi:uncharacterized protein involved in type VI secretion and phage assembly
MAMQRVVQTVGQIARHEIEQRTHTGLGIVRSVHGRNGEASYACTVELRELGLVLPRVPIATGFIGAVALPREGDLVVLLFIGGDLHAPVVVGRLYSDAVSPPLHAADETVVSLPGGEDGDDKRMELRIKTPGDGTRTAALVLDGDVKVELEVDDEGVRIQAQDARIEVKQTGSSDGRVELKVGDSKVVIEQAGDVTVAAKGTLKLEASKIEIKADATVKVKGQTVELN